MIEGAKNQHQRILVIGSHQLEADLRVVLSSHGYFVEHCRTRLEGLRQFRARKQSIVILDMVAIQGFPTRLFRFFRQVRASTVVLIAADKQEQALASRYLLSGAHDILHLPLNVEALNSTLSRVSLYQRSIVRSVFIKHALFFAALMLPIWAALIYVILR
jgi:PleD family two-component response regulator